MLKKRTVLLTMGDGRGIGPEVIIRALASASVRRLANLLVIGDLNCLRRAAKIFKTPLPLKEINLREIINSKKVIFDKDAINILNLTTENEGLAPLRYIDTALVLLNKKRASALVTAPVNKESITNAGIAFSGHTEYLARFTKTKKFSMMFVGDRLKVTVVTRHIPLKNVSRVLTKEKVADAIEMTHAFLTTAFDIERPRIGVCGLNPHAGEGGLLGSEEEDIILPAVKGLKKRISRLSGPIPADSAFNLLYKGSLDGLIAMYHDQAMIPVKMVGREGCVNITLGLPFIRTSPVHGTAYDIAGKGVADPSSMVEAIRLACRLSKVKC